jgi:hypothetical protein
MNNPKFKIRRYALWSYDVWGNRDGFEVNDRRSHGTVTIRCEATIHNAGTAHQFVSYDPTDRQLSRAAGVRRVEWDGVTDEGFYASLKSNGKPICELIYEGEEDGTER